MYTALYARVSTGMQAIEGTSLDGQVELCMKKAIELGFSENNLKIYKEEGFSGEDIDRPAMTQLRQDIATGLISRVVITHPDRLSRDLTDKLFICREFEARQVSLIFVDTEYKNTPEGQLFFNLISVIAQYELSLIKKRTVRGRLKAVEKDKKIMPMRVPPFGYDWVESSLIVNEEEANMVKMIYHWYVYEHLTMRQIGNKLVEMGATPKRAESDNWSASSIQRILKSEIYIGKYYYNRRSTRKIKGERTKSGTPKKTYTIRDEKDWIFVEVPSIITDQLFHLAQEQRKKNTKQSGNVKNDYLLKSLLRCGHCGRKWAATTYSGRVNKSTGMQEKYKCYRCPNMIPKTYGKTVNKCPSRSIRAEKLDDYLWSLIMQVVSNPQDYLQRLSYNADKIIEELKLAVVGVKKQMEVKRKEAERVKIMFKKEVIDEQEMEAEFHTIKAEMMELQERFETYNAQIDGYKKELSLSEKSETTINKICEFINQNGEQLNLQSKRYIVETLVNELIIGCEDSNIHITAIGHLDRLISLGPSSSVDENFCLQESKLLG
ncbi:MAG: integration/recombination/inversion protein [Neobacillus sp.]|jgi:site-specific DNA recombinase|nr:integration/recombination/inversion protein [Neobacillus sp.]